MSGTVAFVKAHKVNGNSVRYHAIARALADGEPCPRCSRRRDVRCWRCGRTAAQGEAVIIVPEYRS